MAAVLQTLLKRQLGFRCSSKRPLFDTKLQLLTLTCTNEDAPRVGENEDNLFDSVPIYHIQFCPINFHPHLLAVTDELGFVSIVNTTPGIGEYDKVVLKEQCHPNALYNLDWSPHLDGVLATCAGESVNQSVKVWDIKQDFGNIATFKGHERTVKSVKFHPSNRDCLVSGSRDGTIRFWDTRSGGAAVNIIKQAYGLGAAKDVNGVTDVLFHDEFTVISCGSADGVIKFWDLRKTYSGLKKMVPVSTVSWKNSSYEIQGYHSMCLDNQNHLYASTLYEVHKYNLNSEEGQINPAHFLSPNPLNYYIKINTSPDDRFLISGSTAGDAYVWDTYDSCVEPFMVLPSASPNDYIPTCVAAFCPCDELKIVTGNDEGKLLIWRPRLAENEDVVIKDPSVVTAARRIAVDEKITVLKYCTERLINQSPEETNNIKEKSANKRESDIARLRTYFEPPNFKKLSLITDDNNENENNKKEERKIELSSLLQNLPNFVMDGIHPSVIKTPTRTASATPIRNRKTCWLEELQLHRNCVSPNNINNNSIIGNLNADSRVSESNFSANSSTLNGVSVGEKRPSSGMTASSNHNQPQAKKLKLKLKVLTTPKRSPKPRIPLNPKTSAARASAAAGPGSVNRRTSTDSPAPGNGNNGKSPQTHKILKYFIAVERPSPLRLSAESASM